MLGKILGAVAGKQVADHTAGLSGPAGMIGGVVAATVLRRASLPALVAITAGGYALKKYKERKDREAALRGETPAKPAAAAA